MPQQTATTIKATLAIKQMLKFTEKVMTMAKVTDNSKVPLQQTATDSSNKQQQMIATTDSNNHSNKCNINRAVARETKRKAKSYLPQLNPMQLKYLGEAVAIGAVGAVVAAVVAVAEAVAVVAVAVAAVVAAAVAVAAAAEKRATV